ncbi:membrane protein [Pontibacillus chungwhensis BH030062]|uniref:Membrane protein n=1 Tax=Pontibacillus chungwhensis BH030062 TaxID=1385513 RepID=A0A0A2UQQ2_9BACI|nr:EamA family transporter [Pontibacillus chungwhensis]KGP90269.1 membrane protein [Pontibacillus chungwhensis BH030062]
MNYTGILFVLTSAVLWGITGGVGDILMNKGWGPATIAFYRGFVGFIFFTCWYLFRRKKIKIKNNNPHFYSWAALAGIGVAGNFTFYFLAIESAGIPIAATLMYTAPIFVLLVSFLLGIERSSLFKWASIAFVLVGVILLTGAYSSGTEVSFMGIVAGLGAGISYAFFIFGFKKAAKLGSPQATLTIAFFAFILVMLLRINFGEAISVVSSNDIGWFIVLGIIGAGLSFILYVRGVKRTAPSTASIIAMVEPVTASLFGIMLLGNSLTLMQYAGMGLILATITVLSVKQSS